MEDLSKKYDERTLKLIISTLLEVFEEESLDYENNFDDTICDHIDDSLKYIGINIKNWDDYTFYVQLVRINPNYETESIKVPELGKYEVDLDVTLTEYAVETWRHDVYSYFDQQNLIKEQLTNYPDHSYWEGNMIDKDVYDSYTDDVRVSHVERVNKFRK